MNTDIHISYWLTACANQHELSAALDRLSREERIRQAQLVFPRDQRDFAAAHALLRHALSAQGDRPTDDWTFVTGPHGKPQLAPGVDDGTQLSFNLSHTHGLVACAVTRDADVGIDVESIGRSADVLELARRYFSPVEVANFERCEETERPTQFIEIWTLKEAYMKATGDGLSRRLDEFAFVFDGPTSLRFESTSGSPSVVWQFALFAPSDHHRLAVAVQGASGRHRSFVVRSYDGERFQTPVMSTLLRSS